MKYLEWFGVLLAATGFTCLAVGFMLWGWIMGIASCFMLIYYFHESNQTGLFSLQSYFLAANILGLFNTTGVI